jgi:Orsellinic acid/F9775 biosynthesis cluster protein D
MSAQHLESYITHLPTFQVVVCRLCESCISPNNPLRHYEDNHTAKKAHPVPSKVRHEITNYMATLDLCQPKEVIHPHHFVPELKVIKNGFICNFPNCGRVCTSEESMRKHYYVHQKSIPKSYKNWESTCLQTFFNGQNKKYINLYQRLIVDTLR